MNRGYIVAAAVLGGITSFGALHSKLTAAAPVTSEEPAVAPLRVSSSPREHKVVTPLTPPPSSNPEREHLEARRLLYETVDAFLQAGELEKARQLLDDEQARHGDDLAPEWRDFEQSYRLIADCLSDPTPQQRARARAFTLVSQAVALKPRILAACRD